MLVTGSLTDKISSFPNNNSVPQHLCLELKRISGSKKITTISLAQPIPTPSSYILKSFINGYKGTSISQISISIFTENLTFNSVDVVVEVGSGMNLSSIYISYVAFDYKGGA